MKLCITVLALLLLSTIAPLGLCADLPVLSDPAQEIEVERGADFTITLESNRTTGYAWELADSINNERVKFVSSEYVPQNAGMIGSGGREIWTFRAVAPGKAAIAMVYARPWEKGVAPAKKAAFAICVRDAQADNTEKEDRCSGKK